MNRAFHAIMYTILTMIGGTLMGVYGNPSIGFFLAFAFSTIGALIVGGIVVNTFDKVRNARPFSRFLIAAIWGAASGATIGLVMSWGHNKIIYDPSFPTIINLTSDLILSTIGLGLASGFGAMITPSSMWQSNW